MNKSKDYSWLLILVFFFFAGLLTLHYETFLTWDGSRHLFGLLEANGFRGIRDRFSMTFFQIPTVILKTYSYELPLWYYKKAYGLIYSFIPFIVLTLCWFKLRKISIERFYFIAFAFGVCFIIQQTHFIGEHLIACQLFFLLLCYLDSDTFKEKLIEFFIALFITFLHPVSCYLILLYCFFKYLIGKRSRDDLIPFLLLVIFRSFILFSSRKESKLLSLNNYFSILDFDIMSFPLLYRDLPVVMTLSFFIVAIMLVIRKDFLLPLFFHIILFFTSYYVWRAHDKHSTIYILKARNLIFIGATPFYFAHVYLFNIKRIDLSKIKFPAIVASLLFLIIMSYEGRFYKSSLQELDRAIYNIGQSCVSSSNIKLINPLKRKWTHWATFYEYVMFKEKRGISTMIIQSFDCNKRPHKYYLSKMLGGGRIVRSGRYFQFKF